MSGVKGRSGKTDNQADKQRAGRIGAMTRWGHLDHADDTPQDPAQGDADTELLDMLPGTNPYDRVVLKTKGRFSYLDAKTREQSNGELLANDRRRMEIDQAKAKLLTREQHREAIASIVAAILDSSSSLVTAAVSLHSPEHQPKARHAMDQAMAKWREDAMAKIKSA